MKAPLPPNEAERRGETPSERSRLALLSLLEDLQQSQQALRQSEERLRLALEAAQAGAWEWDLRTNECVWSEEIWQLFGLEPHSCTPSYEAWWQTIHPDDRSQAEHAVREAAHQGTDLNTEWRVCARDGTERWLLSRGRPVRDASGQVGRFMGIALDITVRKRTEEALRVEEERFRLVVESATNGIVMVDQESRITLVNQEAERIFGYPRQELLGAPIEILVPAALRAQHEQDHLAFRAQPGTRPMGIGRELYGQRKDGSIIPIEIGLTPVILARTTFFLATIVDITIRKQVETTLQQAKEAAEAAQRAAEASNRAKSDFLARMSHELRTPLNAILGYIQIFQRDPTLTPRQQEGIAIMQQSGEHLLHLITDLLDMTKIDTGQFTLQPAPVALAPFVTGLVAMVQDRATAKGLACTTHLDPGLPAAVCVDVTRLREVLLNLLTNAIKYTEVGGVTLTLTRRSPPEATEVAVRFQVTDTGRGIAADEQEAIFAPFYQVGTLSMATEGVGLGLAISRHLVQRMGGTLQVTSTLGQGSTFWFDLRLPVAETAPVCPSSGSLPSIVGYSGAPRTILLVDDHASNRAVLRAALEPLGFTVTEASTGQDAVEQVTTAPPDLLVLDLMMPGLDGQAVIRHIRQRLHLQALPIIACTADLTGTMQTQCLAAGADAFLPKPIAVEALLAAVATHLRLTWRYAPLPLQAPEPPAPSPDGLVLPPAAELRALRTYAQSGLVSRLAQHLTALSQADAAYQPFVAHLRRLADQFAFADILAVLDHYLERKEP